VCLKAMAAILLVVASSRLLAEGPAGLELARSLANDQLRGGAVDEMATRGEAGVALLLSWARRPPGGVDKAGLYIGLSDAFGRMRAKDAIPFLSANISIQRGVFERADIWMKSPPVIEGAMPAAAALIRIGPEASRFLVHKFQTLSPEDRLAAIFVISRIKGVPEARELLDSVIGQANLETFWAKWGLGELAGDGVLEIPQGK